ncbi:MAG TPA: glycoside hydrolase family 30 protein [Candidatus Saccharimonadales bacterium]|nr:glycoside hydrolase family 30 protein [Candidatus Saccharimonadales bacterium]
MRRRKFIRGAVEAFALTAARVPQTIFAQTRMEDSALDKPISPSISAFDEVFCAKAAEVYLTVKDTNQRLAKGDNLNFFDLSQPDESEQSIIVDPSKRFQTVLGIGGALTDAAAETFSKLPEDKQREVLRAYFDPQNGIGYSLGRTHINSCDFSSYSYTYVENGDMDLASFDISHDLKYRIPFIKEVLAIVGEDNFTLFASPWSPPGWMKDNNDLFHGGKLKPECHSCWANYYVSFIKAYQKRGIPIWGITVQNEPMAVQAWESCVYTAEEERDFVKNYLGPILASAGLGEKRIMIWDHNRNLIYQRAKEILDDPLAAKYVWGVAYHWFVGDNFENVIWVQEAYPNFPLILSEGCNGPFNIAKINDWDGGEHYGKSMVCDFNNGASGWTDWNILLDENGGPNHVQNFCFAPIHANTKTGSLCYMNSYYYIGHFAKFVRPGAKRIISSSTTDNLLTTAFLNKNGDIAVIVMNSSEASQSFYLWMNNKAAKSESPAHSIMTLVISRA